MWPEYFRAIREIRPKIALIENVRGLLSKGMHDVLRDLASIRYDAEWQVIPALALGAPHRRERVFIMAYPNDGRRLDGQVEVFTAESWEYAQRQLITGSKDMADARSRHSRTRQSSSQRGRECVVKGGETNDSRITCGQSHSRSSFPKKSYGSFNFQKQRRVQDMADCDKESMRELESLQRHAYGQWAVEPDVGRVVDGIPSRVDRIKCLGNAVVPQVAEAIGIMLLKSGVLQ